MNLTGFIWTNWRRSLLAWSPTHRPAILSFLGNIQITASNIVCFKFSWRLFQLETFFARYRIVFTIAISMWVLKELLCRVRWQQRYSTKIFLFVRQDCYASILSYCHGYGTWQSQLQSGGDSEKVTGDLNECTRKNVFNPMTFSVLKQKLSRVTAHNPLALFIYFPISSWTSTLK